MAGILVLAAVGCGARGNVLSAESAPPAGVAVTAPDGAALMERLEDDPFYRSFGFTADAAALAADTAAVREAIAAWQTPDDVLLPARWPYLLAVNRAGGVVTAYREDENGRYTVPCRAMLCSGGADTPLGFWRTPIRYRWRLLDGPCYGQYATRITRHILFHSVPYFTENADDLEYAEFNRLGEAVSQGCVRMAVADVKWVYDSCPLGTPVVIYDDENDPGPLGRPEALAIDPADTARRGWDPTDPDPGNPWPAASRAGTAIAGAAG